MPRLASLLAFLSALMLALAPSLANAQAMPAPAHAAMASDCHDGAPAKPAKSDTQQENCLALCLMAHGGFLPHTPDANPAYTPVPYLPYPASHRILVSAHAGVDPPPPRRA